VGNHGTIVTDNVSTFEHAFRYHQGRQVKIQSLTTETEKVIRETETEKKKFAPNKLHSRLARSEQEVNAVRCFVLVGNEETSGQEKI
jgi:hypothetical protein